MSGTGTVKSALGSVLPSIRAPRLKRKDLRKYSWLPDVFRVNGSILPRIFGPVLTITLWSTFVYYLSTLGYKLVAVNSIVPLLSVVVGLILVFRNGTSYDRYWEGRKAFATLTTQTRNLARIIWVSVALPPTDEQPPQIKGKTPTTNLTHAQVRARKIDALRLALSFSYAAKHYLRGEDGVNWADYRGVLPKFLTRYDPNYALSASYLATASDPAHPSHDTPDHSISGRTTPDGSRPDATKRVRAKRSKRQLTDPSQPLLGGFSDGFNDEVSLPFPLIVAHHLSRTVFGFRREGLLETVGPAGMNGIITIVSSMVDQLTIMERIANTPIPRSYSIHLKQCVTLYLFSLPLTLVHDLGWVAVPLVTAVAFTFMGIEGIAEEIEMPFGTDERDLPLDQYCQDLKEEIYFVIEKLPEGGEGIHGYDDGEGDD